MERKDNEEDVESQLCKENKRQMFLLKPNSSFYFPGPRKKKNFTKESFNKRDIKKSPKEAKTTAEEILNNRENWLVDEEEEEL